MNSVISNVLSNVSFNQTPVVKQVAIGIGLGSCTFFIVTRIINIASKIFEMELSDNMAKAMMSDSQKTSGINDFQKLAVLFAPLAEELVFRVALPYLMTPVINRWLVQSNISLLGRASSLLNISQVKIITSVVVGIIFGIAHRSNFKKGGNVLVFTHSIMGIVYGLAKERYGLLTSFVAHTTQNIIGSVALCMLTTLMQKKTKSFSKES